jgi:DNA-binding NarL/FixJ family response regulator
MGEQLLDDLAVVRLLQRTFGRVYAQEANPLSPRETAVLSLVARGVSTRAIARQLGISENTVKNHLRNIHQKLGVRCRAHAVAIATRAHWLD